MLKNSYVSGNKLFTFIIISTFFLIILNWILSDFTQLVIYFSSVLLFGIIHGANDIYLIIRGNNKNKKISKTTFIYVFIVLLITLIFFSFPLLSLIFFVLFSCYHFGEQQWTILDENIDSGLLFFANGLLIFATLFYFHRNEVIEIVFMISNFIVIEDFFKWLLITSILLTVISLLINYKRVKSQILNQIILFPFLMIVFSQLSLFNSFAVYFVIYHSIPSIMEQTNFLYGSSTFPMLKKYFITALPYWITALIGLLVFYLIFSINFTFSLDIFFSFLAAITFPHVIVIYKMKKITNDKI